MGAPQALPPTNEGSMAIEQFIDNELKGNDVVLFMKGTRSFRCADFPGRWCRSSTTSA
jgi:monothiol glutaredoxin